jgi:hypothetical protein
MRASGLHHLFTAQELQNHAGFVKNSEVPPKLMLQKSMLQNQCSQEQRGFKQRYDPSNHSRLREDLICI